MVTGMESFVQKFRDYADCYRCVADLLIAFSSILQYSDAKIQKITQL